MEKDLAEEIKRVGTDSANLLPDLAIGKSKSSTWCKTSKVIWDGFRVDDINLLNRGLKILVWKICI
jgi:hypothetical protein